MFWAKKVLGEKFLDKYDGHEIKILKRGCTRFELEHLSCNLLLYTGKAYSKLGKIVFENLMAFHVPKKLEFGQKTPNLGAILSMCVCIYSYTQYTSIYNYL